MNHCYIVCKLFKLFVSLLFAHFVILCWDERSKSQSDFACDRNEHEMQEWLDWIVEEHRLKLQFVTTESVATLRVSGLRNAKN